MKSEILAEPEKLIRSFNGLFDVMRSNGRGEYDQIQGAVGSIMRELQSPNFKGYIASFGNWAYKMPKDYPGVFPENSYLKHVIEVSGRINSFVSRSAYLCGLPAPDFYLDCVELRGFLCSMKLLNSSIDDAFSGNYEH